MMLMYLQLNPVTAMAFGILPVGAQTKPKFVLLLKHLPELGVTFVIMYVSGLANIYFCSMSKPSECRSANYALKGEFFDDIIALLTLFLAV
jgi:hypothetical protein